MSVREKYQQAIWKLKEFLITADIKVKEAGKGVIDYEKVLGFMMMAENVTKRTAESYIEALRLQDFLEVSEKFIEDDQIKTIILKHGNQVH